MPQTVSALCCECGNCLQICPRSAIELQHNSTGSSQAVIDPGLCIDCHLCSNSCPMQNPAPRKIPLEAYGALSQSSEAIHSTSGGIFFELASAVLKNNGLVSGAAYGDDWSVSHILTGNQSDLIKLQGSKYVKSAVKTVFTQIKESLQQGETVLFSGTPCQVAALQRFIKEPGLRERLITVDLICHGTPPASLFKDFLSSLEKKHHGKVCNFTFRNKSFGSKLQGTFTIQKGNSKRRYPLYSSEIPYYYLFLKGLTYTECCYTCSYATPERCGDITIGDFWGWQREIPEFAQKFNLPGSSSVSAVMVNTEKGKRLFQQVQPTLFTCPVPYEQIKRNNAQLCSPVQVNPDDRKRIWDVYMQDGYDGLIHAHKEMTDLRRYASRVADCIPSGIKAKLKRMLQR